MAGNLIAVKNHATVNVSDDGSAKVQIVTRANTDGTSSLVLSIECPLDPNDFRVLAQNGLNPDGSPKYPFKPGEIGYLLHAQIHEGDGGSDKFSIIYNNVTGGSQLNLTAELGPPKIDWGN